MTVAGENDKYIGIVPVGHYPLIDMIEHDKIGVILLMKGRSILRLYNAARHLADPRYVRTQRLI